MVSYASSIAKTLVDVSDRTSFRKRHLASEERDSLRVNADGDLEYSNAFEKHVSINLAVSLLVMGFSAFMANASMHLWKHGAFLGSISETITAFLSSHKLFQILYSVVFMVLAARAVISHVAAYTALLFIFAMDTTSKRHWRHMTSSVYIKYAIASVVLGAVVVYLGTKPVELVIVIGPILNGGCLLWAAHVMDMDAGEDCISKRDDIEKAEA